MAWSVMDYVGTKDRTSYPKCRWEWSCEISVRLFKQNFARSQAWIDHFTSYWPLTGGWVLSNSCFHWRCRSWLGLGSFLFHLFLFPIPFLARNQGLISFSPAVEVQVSWILKKTKNPPNSIVTTSLYYLILSFLFIFAWLLEISLSFLRAQLCN